jgi:hypothetical protein
VALRRAIGGRKHRQPTLRPQADGEHQSQRQRSAYCPPQIHAVVNSQARKYQASVTCVTQRWFDGQRCESFKLIDIPNVAITEHGRSIYTES